MATAARRNVRSTHRHLFATLVRVLTAHPWKRGDCNRKNQDAGNGFLHRLIPAADYRESSLVSEESSRELNENSPYSAHLDSLRRGIARVEAGSIGIQH
jgi:hypothetical protein